MMKKADQPTFDYAGKVAELEAVLARLQDNAVSLDEAIELHEKGKKLAAELENYLDEAALVIHNHITEDKS